MTAIPPLSKPDIDAVLDSAAGVTPPPGAQWRLDQVPHDPLLRHIQALSHHQFIFVFDWTNEFSRGGDPRFTCRRTLAQADLTLLRKLMTAHLRMDRFSDNHLAGLIISGYWQACLDRLQALRRAM
ncbi:DUF6508 domain-containing protein [Serratia rubidaea]|uniref:DUF6508 domain-containing protein n=1 Tax=Serratia rubidaea TaxID=61652 RepID=UPI001BAF22C5|nr:DUF6508 domain-containing protein [Serratia rubidaea]MBS0974782.1 hypothetical protein [Serratia rubidaea]